MLSSLFDTVHDLLSSLAQSRSCFVCWPYFPESPEASAMISTVALWVVDMNMVT